MKYFAYMALMAGVQAELGDSFVSCKNAVALDDGTKYDTGNFISLETCSADVSSESCYNAALASDQTAVVGKMGYVEFYDDGTN